MKESRAIYFLGPNTDALYESSVAQYWIGTKVNSNWATQDAEFQRLPYDSTAWSKVRQLTPSDLATSLALQVLTVDTFGWLSIGWIALMTSGGTRELGSQISSLQQIRENHGFNFLQRINGIQGQHGGLGGNTGPVAIRPGSPSSPVAAQLMFDYLDMGITVTIVSVAWQTVAKECRDLEDTCPDEHIQSVLEAIDPYYVGSKRTWLFQRNPLWGGVKNGLYKIPAGFVTVTPGVSRPDEWMRAIQLDNYEDTSTAYLYDTLFALTKAMKEYYVNKAKYHKDTIKYFRDLNITEQGSVYQGISLS